MSVPTLPQRELNRATLARQMLLARERTPIVRAIERLVGLQAQLARPPFIGLWSRVENFRREDLTRLIRSRKVVRGTLMRATIHLVSAKDYVKLRPAIQPALAALLRSAVGARAQGLDIDALVAAARTAFEERPQTFEELRATLVQHFPKGDVRAMSLAVRMHLPLIQVPTEADWGYPGNADFAVAESWLGEPLDTEAESHTLVLRYLAAFGPATVGDAQMWSGLRGLREVFEELRPNLRTFRDEQGRELFDLPRAPRPSEDTPAPVRFLPEYDNLLLAHDDRTRFLAKEHRSSIFVVNRILPVLLVDGLVAGTWKIERKKASAALVVEPFAALSKKTRDELTSEGEPLVRLVESDAQSFDVQVAKPSSARDSKVDYTR